MPDDVAHLAKQLRLLSGPEFSIATAAAINRIATAVNSGQRMNIQKDFKLRNKFTVGSLMMFKATPKPDADKINALVGSKSPYLPEQETGGVARVASPSGWKVAKTMPSLKMRRKSWGNIASKKIIGGDTFVLRPGVGTVRTRRVGKSKKRRPISYHLKTPGVFVRVGKRVIKVRSILEGPVQLKPTHWHTQATAKFGRPALMQAAWGHEMEKGLTKLGAK